MKGGSSITKKMVKADKYIQMEDFTRVNIKIM